MQTDTNIFLKYNTLLHYTQKMRHYQREDKKWHCSRDLDNAKLYQRKGDAIIKSENLIITSPQKNLFQL